MKPENFIPLLIGVTLVGCGLLYHSSMYTEVLDFLDQVQYYFQKIRGMLP